MLHLPARGSLARQFAWAAGALAAVAVLAIAAGSWWWIDRLQRDAIAALVAKDAELHASQLTATLGDVAGRMEEFAGSPLLSTALTDSSGREAYVRPYIDNIKTIGAIPIELVFLDFQGEEIARNGDLSLTAEQLAWARGRLQAGQRGAVVATEPQGDMLLATEMVVYPRTGTVEGALLVKLPVRRLLADPAFRIVAGAGPPPDPGARRLTAIAAPEIFRPLDFAIERVSPVELGDRLVDLPWALLIGGVLLVLAVVVAGLRLAERLTADLRALERFAGRVSEMAFGGERAATSGALEVANLAQSINQMLDRLNQQHSLEQSRSQAQLQLLDACIARLNDVVMITEAQPFLAPGPRILFVNDAFTRMTGYRKDEVIGRTPRMLQGPGTDRAELDRLRQGLERWQPVRSELLNYRKDGSEFWVELDIVPIFDAAGAITHWVSVERDVTERKEAEATRRSLEAQVRQVQKMEAIGTLAGGVAHDFNNILGAILGNVALVRQDVAAGRPPLERLEQISRSAGRARSLIDQILTFSRQRPQFQLQAQRLQPLVEETAALLRATVPARVRLETELPAEPLHAMVDGTALQQILMNLATNAWHALQGSSGSVRIGLGRVDLPLPERGAIRSPELPPGPHAHLWVADDGCGMDATTQARVFEPFFTTKPVGSGTGLGLSVVLGIVQSHHGAIGVDSAPGAGTTFHVFLPLSPPPAAAADGSTAGAAAAAERAGNGEHILYIDDDEVLATMAGALLERWGYRVTAMRDAQAAIEAVRADPAAFDMVVTDFNMPELSGIDVLKAVGALRPDLPVILTSGYLADEVRDEALDAGARGLLRKESIHDELSGLIARVLGKH